MPEWMSRQPLRGRGGTVVALICAYELVALTDAPVPTISEVVERGRWGRVLGIGLLAGFACHWWVRFGEDVVEAVIDEIT